MFARRRPTVLATTLLLSTAIIAAPTTAAVRLAPIGVYEQPVYVTAPPGDTSRVFVVERTGTIRVLVDGVRQTKPFLNIRARVSQPPGPSDERGLMSLAFAPDYATSGRFYVYHTVRQRLNPAASNIVLDEYRAVPPNALTVSPSTRRRVLALPGGTIHFGGQLAFGPDGMLWLGPGDGRGPGDPLRNGQNRWTLKGKLVRIDPREGHALAPQGNPHLRHGGAKLVWATGLRNPYRFSFDRETGDLTIADVGQNFLEEVNFVPRASGWAKGGNFGWSTLEGRYRFRRATPTKLRPATAAELPERYVAPAIEHLHSRGWCAIVGGYVVRDRNLPELAGQYVYGDFCKGEIHSAHLAAGRRARPRSLGLRVPLLSSFGEDGCGRIYVTSLTGPVYRLTSSGACGTGLANNTPGATATSSRSSGAGWWPSLRQKLTSSQLLG